MNTDWRESALARGQAHAHSLIGEMGGTGFYWQARFVGEFGEPTEVPDWMPSSPLSGEWAGESIPELFGLNIGDDFPDEEELEEYESLFYEGFFSVLEGREVLPV